jgi:hypothetical protein
VPSSPDSARLTFGIYPGSAAGSDTGEVVSGPPDDPARIVSALEELQGRDRHPLVVRAYRVFADADDRDRRPPAENPLAPVRYTGQGRSVSAAKDEARRRGHRHLQVGFNTTLLFGPAASFIDRLTQAGGQRFVDDLDYVGLDFFPDVFRPVPPAGSRPSPKASWASTAGTCSAQPGSAPSRCGSPSTGGPPAPAGHRNGRPCLFHQFGLMTDDYTPKPAFHAYRELIGALSPGAEGRRGRPGSRPDTGTPPPTRP